jgi:hypothetical protein
MIDLNARLSEIITHPIPTAIGGGAVGMMGVLNNFFDDLPSVHVFLSDASMLVGFVTCIVALRVQLKIEKLKALDLQMRAMEIEKFSREFTEK